MGLKENVKRLREQMKLSQQEPAEQVGVNQAMTHIEGYGSSMEKAVGWKLRLH